ncbi:golvesin C-terminal-like domain-containing protein [Phytohabitans rumicis]|uniref:golvesin C-terminal-like domain-containing protein n=1 Tax=Phytohabitans rumicis TaxID=1076125 RepID=UPI003FCEC808
MRVHLRPVRHRGDADLRAPRLQRDGLPRRRAVRPVAAAAYRRRGRAERHHAGLEHDRRQHLQRLRGRRQLAHLVVLRRAVRRELPVRQPEEVSDLATYAATIPAAGSYQVEAWYPGIAGYNTSTPFIVYASGGSQVVRVDQSTGGGAWASLGTFSLAAGAQTVVAVSRWTTATGYVIADAVRITRV